MRGLSYLGEILRRRDRKVEERVSNQTFALMRMFFFGIFPEGKTIIYLRDGTKRVIFVPEGKDYRPLIREFFPCDENHADYRCRRLTLPAEYF